MRRATVLVAAVVVLVLAVGATAVLVSRGAGDPEPGVPAVDRGYTVDGRTFPCLTPNVVRIDAAVYETWTATFVVDGVEVPTERTRDIVWTGDVLTERPMARAVMPAEMTRVRCDDGRSVRIDVDTDRPEGCEISFYPVARDGPEAKGSAGTVRLPRGVCSVTVGL